MQNKWRFVTVLVVAALAAQNAAAEMRVRTTRIGHGIEAWYVQNDAVPVVDLQITFEGAGIVSDPESKAGRATFAAAMLTEGAGTYDSKAFARLLDEHAINLDIRSDEDRLIVHVHCLREHAGMVGELLALALTQPTLAEADVARVKSQMLNALNHLEESPQYQAQKLFSQRAFKGHPYANLPYGTAASVASLGPQDVRDYLNTYVTRGNIVIASAGDVDASLINAMVGPTVDALRNGEPAAVTPTVMQGGGEVLKQVSILPQTVINFAAPSVARDDKRFYAVYLLNHILGGDTLTSRLGNQVRREKGLVYGIDTNLELQRGTSLLSGTLATRNSTADAALKEVQNVLAEVHDKGVTTDECNDAKSYVIGHFPLQLDSSQSVSGMLISMQVHKLGESYLNDRVAIFNKVSCGDINAAAKQLLDPHAFLFAVVGGTVDGANTPPNATSVAHDAR